MLGVLIRKGVSPPIPTQRPPAWHGNKKASKEKGAWPDLWVDTSELDVPGAQVLPHLFWVGKGKLYVYTYKNIKYVYIYICADPISVLP